MTLARRGRACQRASTLTVAATLRLAPSWSRRHPKARRKTHPLNFRCDTDEWPTSSAGRENATVLISYGLCFGTMRILGTAIATGAARVDEVAGRSFDVCD